MVSRGLAIAVQVMGVNVYRHLPTKSVMEIASQLTAELHAEVEPHERETHSQKVTRCNAEVSRRMARPLDYYEDQQDV